MSSVPTITLCLTVAAGAAADAPREVRPVIDVVDPSTTAGRRPYEMVRAGRTEARPPLVDFESLAGWRVELRGHAEATVRRSREQRMWGETAAEITYRGTTGENRILLRPPAPLPIPGRPTAVHLWCHGNNWAWTPRPDTPRVELGIWLRDAKERESWVSLGLVGWKDWWLVHRRIVSHLGPEPAYPLSLTGIEVRGGHQSEDRTIFLDSLSFHEEEWPELSFAPRPRRGVDPMPGQDHGLNTGPGRLPFPTREETIVPESARPGSRSRVRSTGADSFELAYEGPDARVVYHLHPTAAGLGDVRVEVDGKPAGRALVDGQIAVADEAGETPRLEEVRLEEGAVHVARSRSIKGQVVRDALTYRIIEKSLIVDLSARGGWATGLDPGAFRDLEEPRAIPIPYANYGGQSHALLARADGRPLFATVWIDWYRSSASVLYSLRQLLPDGARLGTGTRYRPRTDGRRGDLHERLVLTVSPVFEETLPVIPNPPSRHGRAFGGHLWQESWGPSDFVREHRRGRRLRVHGIERLIQCNHEIAWRDGADSFTLRIHAAPAKGGDVALAEYVRRQRSLGWRSGLYTNYTDFAPVNENWDENAVQLEPDRDWRRAWARCYALKPSRAVELDARYAPLVHERYGSDSAYTDVHTAVAPWHYCDYDARVPGAGTFAATFYAYGELLLHDSRVYEGPIFSEGSYHCLYAGLPDGNYAIQYGGYDFAREPLLPQFDLHSIHPLSIDIGMGWTSNFCNWPGWNRPDRISGSVDRFLLATLAYGHIGWLVEEAHSMRLAARSYYVIGPVSARYAMVEPVAVEYLDGDSIVSTSEALASGAYRHSMLRVTYPGGLVLWLNGNRERTWAVSGGGILYVLPPHGWLVRGDDGRLTVLSALVEGRRRDLVVCAEHIFLDARDSHVELPHLAAAGGVVVRSPAAGVVEVIDTGGNEAIGFGAHPSAKDLPPGHVLRRLRDVQETRPPFALVEDDEGRTIGRTDLVAARGKLWLRTHPSGVRYIVRRADGDDAPRPGVEVRGPARAFPGERVDIAAGERVVSVRVPDDARTGRLHWLPLDPHEGNEPGEGSGSTTREWPLLVEPVADVTWTPSTIELRGGEGSVRLTGRLGREGREATLRLDPPEGVTISPVELRGSGPIDVALRILAPTPTVGQLRATVRLDGRSRSLTWRVAPGESRSKVAALHDGARFSWGQCFRGGADTGGDPTTGATFQVERAISCGGVERPGLFSHPPYMGGVGYVFADLDPLRLPDAPCELHLWIGLKDGGHVSDGVVYTILARTAGGESRQVLRETTARREWREVTADLSALRGQEVTLRLVADVGPADNSTSDWAAWGEPTLRLREPIPTVRITAEDSAGRKSE